MLELKQKCPNVYNEFLKGKFVTQKASNKFTSMAHDQIHEQLNAIIKGHGGIMCIT